MKLRLGLPPIAAAAAVALSGSAFAAPQMLGLVATSGPVPMTCTDGACSVELSTFCLQKERPGPIPGTAYRPHKGAALTIVATGPDGSVRRLSAAPHIAVRSARGTTAVRVTLDPRLAKKLGAVRLALEVGRKVSLVPVPLAGDRNPQKPGEVAVTAGPLRALADRVVDRGGPRIEAAKMVNRMINALPAGRTATRRDRITAWRAVPQRDALAGARRRGHAQAAFVYRACEARTAKGAAFTFRQCLEGGHRSLMSRLNVEYWDTKLPGM